MARVKTQQTRREQAEASRRKVLRAARDTFLESGYHAATMGQIAERSGLAVQTVAYYFGTKPRLMSELIAATVRRAMGDVAPIERPGWERAMATATEGGPLIDAFVDEVHPVLMAVARVVDVARIGGMTDPEVQDIHQFHENWRARDCGKLVDALNRIHSLREGLDEHTANDVVLTVLGPDTYRVLSVDRGWDSEKIHDWMKHSIKALLLKPQI